VNQDSRQALKVYPSLGHGFDSHRPLHKHLCVRPLTYAAASFSIFSKSGFSCENGSNQPLLLLQAISLDGFRQSAAKGVL
jgi:hypothetical protein